MARRTGLLGGSFDPVHLAHRRLADVALQELNLDELRWIPAGQPWQKPRKLADAGHRLAMVRLATADEPRFVVDDTELRRSGPSYTIDTVRALQAAAGDADPARWFLIIGQDQYANMPTWRDWPQLLQRVTLAVACRGDARPETPSALADHPHAVTTLGLPALHVSSTDLRDRLGRGALTAEEAERTLHPAVARYIAHHQLYASGAPR